MLAASDYCYLDWAATTPLCEEAASAMGPYLAFGAENVAVGANANSLHTPGRQAFAALEDARRRIAAAVGANRPDEVIFESGATEADNHAIVGILAARRRIEAQRGNASYAPEFVTSPIEHEAVLALLPKLREQGIHVVLVQPDRNGAVPVERLEQVITPNTALVSLMAANNELGTLNDIPALAACAHRAGALFHTDATQALGKVPVDVGRWDVDAASFSAHKLCGPKGIGALYVKARTPLEALLVGGGQELGRRSGTQNVMGAVGFAAACEASVGHLADDAKRLAEMRDYAYRELAALDGVEATVDVLANPDGFLPNIVHVLVDGYESETLILQSDLAGFAVSGGSACSSGSLEPSHVLSSIGISRDKALGALRISFGRSTDASEIERYIAFLKGMLGRRPNGR